MKKIVLIACLLLCNIYILNAQRVSSTLVYDYDADGNRTSLNYIIIRMDDDKNSDITSDESHIPNKIDVDVYPNPTTDYLVISSNSNEQDKQTIIKIVSLQGTVIKECSIAGYMEINMSKYPSGVYFLYVICNENQQLWKIIKK